MGRESGDGRGELVLVHRVNDQTDDVNCTEKEGEGGGERDRDRERDCVRVRVCTQANFEFTSLLFTCQHKGEIVSFFLFRFFPFPQLKTGQPRRLPKRVQ